MIIYMFYLVDVMEFDEEYFEFEFDLFEFLVFRSNCLN